MKRVKTCSYEDANGKYVIAIAVHAKKHGLVKDEVDHVVESMTDGAMRVLESTRYVNAALSKIRVR